MGILFVSCGSGGEKILATGFLEHENIRDDINLGYAINTSAMDHERVKTLFRLANMNLPSNLILKTIGKGLGSGKDISMGLKAYGDYREDIRQELKEFSEKRNLDIAFVFSCLGGGCGTMVTGEVCRDLKETLNIGVIPIVTLPFRREGGIFLSNARKGLEHLLEFDSYPLISDNERNSKYVSSVSSGVRRANRLMLNLISRLVDLVKYGDFAIPPMDIQDLLRIVRPSCGLFTTLEMDKQTDLEKGWKKLLEENVSVDAKPIEKTNAFVVFQGPEFPQKIADEITKHLRKKFRVHNILQTVLENDFEKFSVTAIIYGLAVDTIKPKFEQKGSWLEGSWTPDYAIKKIK